MVIFYQRSSSGIKLDGWDWRNVPICRDYLIDPKRSQNIDCCLSIHTPFRKNARYSDIQLLVADWCVCISNLGGFHGMVIKTKIEKVWPYLFDASPWHGTLLRTRSGPSYLDIMLKFERLSPHATKESFNIE
jgi:hypothetical protein